MNVSGFAAASIANPGLRTLLLQLCDTRGSPALVYRDVLKAQLDQLQTVLLNCSQVRGAAKENGKSCTFVNDAGVLARLLAALGRLAKVQARRVGDGSVVSVDGVFASSSDSSSSSSAAVHALRDDKQAYATPSASTELGRRASADQYWEKGAPKQSMTHPLWFLLTREH